MCPGSVMQIETTDSSLEVCKNKKKKKKEISTANLLPLCSLQPGAVWARLNQMESSMGQMSNQREREGHAMEVGETVMQAHGGLNLHCNSSEENPTNIRMSRWRTGWKSEMFTAFAMNLKQYVYF